MGNEAWEKLVATLAPGVYGDWSSIVSKPWSPSFFGIVHAFSFNTPFWNTSIGIYWIQLTCIELVTVLSSSDFCSFCTGTFCTAKGIFRSLLNESCLIGISLFELRSGEHYCDSFHILSGEKLALLVTTPPAFCYDLAPASRSLGKFSIYCYVFGL